MIPEPPSVSVGDKFTRELWNKLVSYARALNPQPGSNTRITRLPGSFIISFDPPDTDLNHPFQCTLSGKTVSISDGLISQTDPTIGGVPLSGVKDGQSIAGGAPTLTVQVTSDSWIVLEVTTDATGTITEATISQQSENITSVSPTVGRIALAMIRIIDSTPTLFQIVYHNLDHAWIKPATGIGRHFFWAV